MSYVCGFLRFFLMLKQERHTFILKQINLHNKVLSVDLCRQLSVSEDTIRRDLVELADNNQVVKVHGGALSKSFHFSYEQPEIYAFEAKKIIAHKAVGLVKNNMHVLLGGGTTISQIVQSLPQDLHTTFFTVSLMTALQLCDHPTCEVVFLGEAIAKDSQIAKGGQVISRLAEIKMDLCLLGANSIDIDSGVTDSDMETVQVKKAMIKASAQVGIVTISEKLASSQRFQVCDLQDIDYLITEKEPSQNALHGYLRKGVEVR